MSYPDTLIKLMRVLERLPGVGPKTAERYALHLCHHFINDTKDLIDAMKQASEQVQRCKNCMNVAQENPCRICKDTVRDQTLVCVVAIPPDVEAYERSGEYKGVYHVLQGLINPIEGIGPEALTVKELVHSINSGKIKEVILGFDPSVEGEVTAAYLSKLIAPAKIKLTRIARGLPMGASIEYADDATLANALINRKNLREDYVPN